LIEENKIIVNILDDTDFIKKYKELGGTAENALVTDAFAYGEKIYHRSSSSIDKFFSEVVHEGTHAKDYIDDILDTGHSWEKRASFYERAFQEATGMEKDFDTIYAMLEFIYNNY
jgi:hypothetical protein